jgi:hypothetical protein
MIVTLYFVVFAGAAILAYAIGWWRGYDCGRAEGYRIGCNHGLGHRYVSVKQRCDFFEAECKKLSLRIRNQRLALRRRMAQLAQPHS